MTNLQRSSRVNITLDLILKTLVSSDDFNELQGKNWDTIARLVPGSSATQCSRRYQELLSTRSCPAFIQIGKSSDQPSSTNLSQGSASESDSKTSISSRQKGVKEDRENTESKREKTSHDKLEYGPIMVIHVCDEAKNLRQDFNCPRDMLVREMKYFAEYLSTDAQRWEEVDISVHCDVQIFDWLMKYVKRTKKDTPEAPKLEANNVVSILISSDFLKMDNLVQECVEFSHRNMTAIVSTNCNMNCINDKLVTRISELFTHNEVDDIKDRKDKFKSKLFMKKLEKLFEPDVNNLDSVENAATLFRCSVCKRVLTSKLESRVKCCASRMTVDRRGRLTFCHIRDPSFDVNDYLLELKGQLKYWRDVYWRMWGTINSLSCSRCSEIFPLTGFGHCRYHPEVPRYDNTSGSSTSLMSASSSSSSAIGLYPCCQQMTMRFDPAQLNKGCRVKDHIITFDDASSGELDSPRHKMYDDLLGHRDTICIAFQRPTEDIDSELNIFGNEIFASSSRSSGVRISKLLCAGEEDKKVDNRINKPQPRLQALTVDRDVSFEVDEFAYGESDDEIGDEETQKARKARATRKSRVTIDPQAILLDAPGFEQTKKSTWDTQRSMRYNQDAQRQEDQRRMKDIRLYLTKLRLSADRIDKPKKEFYSGIYGKLEAQWKNANLTQVTKQTNQTQLRTNKSKMFQARPSFY